MKWLKNERAVSVLKPSYTKMIKLGLSREKKCLSWQ